MSLPSANTNNAFENFVQELPPDSLDLAYKFKAFCRARKIKTPEQLLRVVMQYCGIDDVLREVAGNFTLLEERITDTAIHNRLKACVPWVKALLQKVMGTSVGPLIEGNLRFVVIDGSTVQGPGAKGIWYRLHIAVDLVRLHLLHVTVTDKYEGENLGYYPLQEGDVAIVDRGYNQPKYLIEMVNKGVGVVLRYNPHGMSIYNDRMDKIDLYKRLKGTAEKSQCVAVRICKGNEYIEGYVHAIPLPEEQAGQARSQLHANAKKKGYTPTERALYLAGWVLIFSTVPPAVLPSDTVAALYRVRWQVELVIKRMKSLLDIDKLRARENSALADLYLHGKLLYTWVLEKLVRRRCGENWNRLDQPRRATPWRIWKLLRQELTVTINGVLHWDMSRWQDCLHVLQERPRRRKLQVLPTDVCRIIAFCQAHGLSNV
uniref:Transposase DDE domain-containing protein n=1 Tax=Candidatus Kentrum sp. DK TaxID=2126562 RepID=A0A450SFG7_9GAMM|nr:MAG: Transposase DDE domain-containing protein [Candidatus Kentron sp. DK]